MTCFNTSQFSKWNINEDLIVPLLNVTCTPTVEVLQRIIWTLRIVQLNFVYVILIESLISFAHLWIFRRSFRIVSSSTSLALVLLIYYAQTIIIYPDNW